MSEDLHWVIVEHLTVVVFKNGFTGALTETAESSSLRKKINVGAF